MNFLIAFVCTVLTLKVFFYFMKKKPKIRTWANKPFYEELTYQEKRNLILRLNEPRTQNSSYGWERNTQDIHFFSILDRFTMSAALGSIRDGERVPLGGEMVTATPEVVANSSKNAKSIYNMIKEEYNIDLIKLAERDLNGADLSKGPLI